MSDWSTDVKEFFADEKTKYFLGGVVAAYAVKKISETDAAHDFLVGTTAALMGARDSAEESIENIREDAEDIRSEAQDKTKIDICEDDEEQDSD